MSISRALSRRIRRGDVVDDSPIPPVPALPATLPTHSKTLVDRAKISSPIALVSTTNMLSYNAPNVATFHKTRSSSISSTVDAADDSDHSSSVHSRTSSHASHDTLTDASSVSSSSPTSPAPNHLSGYFSPVGKNHLSGYFAPTRKSILRRSASYSQLQQLKELVSGDATVPPLPDRALSHSKRAHERLAHKRSVHSLSRHNSLRSSIDASSPNIPEDEHPFGKELEQLNEVVEEFSDVVRDAALESSLVTMRERNLASVCAADYLAAIQPLYSMRFEETVAWI